MKTPIEKMQVLQEKMDHLKIEQGKIEQELIHDWVQVLKKKDAFKLDFNALVGGLLEVIETIQSNPERKEGWQKSGQKFCHAKLQIKAKRFKTDWSLEKNHVTD